MADRFWHDRLEQLVSEPASVPEILKSDPVQPNSFVDPFEKRSDDDPVYLRCEELPLFRVPIISPEDLVAMQKAGRELGMWSGARSEEGIEEDYEHELDHLHAAEVCGRGLVRVIVSIYRILDKEK